MENLFIAFLPYSIFVYDLESYTGLSGVYSHECE